MAKKLNVLVGAELASDVTKDLNKAIEKLKLDTIDVNIGIDKKNEKKLIAEVSDVLGTLFAHLNIEKNIPAGLGEEIAEILVSGFNGSSKNLEAQIDKVVKKSSEAAKKIAKNFKEAEENIVNKKQYLKENPRDLKEEKKWRSIVKEANNIYDESQKTHKATEEYKELDKVLQRLEKDFAAVNEEIREVSSSYSKAISAGDNSLKDELWDELESLQEESSYITSKIREVQSKRISGITIDDAYRQAREKVNREDYVFDDDISQEAYDSVFDSIDISKIRTASSNVEILTDRLKESEEQVKALDAVFNNFVESLKNTPERDKENSDAYFWTENEEAQRLYNKTATAQGDVNFYKKALREAEEELNKLLKQYNEFIENSDARIKKEASRSEEQSSADFVSAEKEKQSVVEETERVSSQAYENTSSNIKETTESIRELTAETKKYNDVVEQSSETTQKPLRFDIENFKREKEAFKELSERTKVLNNAEHRLSNLISGVKRNFSDENISKQIDDIIENARLNNFSLPVGYGKFSDGFQEESIPKYRSYYKKEFKKQRKALLGEYKEARDEIQRELKDLRNAQPDDIGFLKYDIKDVEEYYRAVEEAENQYLKDNDLNKFNLQKQTAHNKLKDTLKIDFGYGAAKDKIAFSTEELSYSEDKLNELKDRQDSLKKEIKKLYDEHDRLEDEVGPLYLPAREAERQGDSGPLEHVNAIFKAQDALYDEARYKEKELQELEELIFEQELLRDKELGLWNPEEHKKKILERKKREEEYRRDIWDAENTTDKLLENFVKQQKSAQETLSSDLKVDDKKTTQKTSIETANIVVASEKEKQEAIKETVNEQKRVQDEFKDEERYAEESADAVAEAEEEKRREIKNTADAVKTFTDVYVNDDLAKESVRYDYKDGQVVTEDIIHTVGEDGEPKTVQQVTEVDSREELAYKERAQAEKYWLDQSVRANNDASKQQETAWKRYNKFIMQVNTANREQHEKTWSDTIATLGKTEAAIENLSNTYGELRDVNNKKFFKKAEADAYSNSLDEIVQDIVKYKDSAEDLIAVQSRLNNLLSDVNAKDSSLKQSVKNDEKAKEAQRKHNEEVKEAKNIYNGLKRTLDTVRQKYIELSRANPNMDFSEQEKQLASLGSSVASYAQKLNKTGESTKYFERLQKKLLGRLNDVNALDKDLDKQYANEDKLIRQVAAMEEAEQDRLWRQQIKLNSDIVERQRKEQEAAHNARQRELEEVFAQEEKEQKRKYQRDLRFNSSVAEMQRKEQVARDKAVAREEERRINEWIAHEEKKEDRAVALEDKRLKKRNAAQKEYERTLKQVNKLEKVDTSYLSDDDAYKLIDATEGYRRELQLALDVIENQKSETYDLIQATKKLEDIRKRSAESVELFTGNADISKLLYSFNDKTNQNSIDLRAQYGDLFDEEGYRRIRDLESEIAKIIQEQGYNKKAVLAVQDKLNSESRIFVSNLKASAKEIQEIEKRARVLNSSLGRFVQFYGFGELFRGIKQGASSMYEQIVLVDSAMVELKKVTEETDRTYEKFLDTSAEKAKELGVTMSDYITSVTEFARMGSTFAEAQELARSANIMQMVSENLTADQASEYLISTMQGFDMEANESMKIVDALNNVDRRSRLEISGQTLSFYRETSRSGRPIPRIRLFYVMCELVS